MPITEIAIGSFGTTQTGGTSSAANTTGANLLVLALGWFGTNTPTLSDSYGNTYTPLTETVATGGYNEQIFYCVNPVVGAAHTFTMSVTAGYPVLGYAAFSGVNTSSTPAQAAGGSTASGTSVQPGNLTPAANGSLLITGASWNAGTAGAIDSGFTSAITAPLTSTHLGGGLAYLIQTTAVAVDPTWSWTSANPAAAVMATFVPASAGALAVGTLAASATDAAITLTLSAAPSGGSGSGYSVSVYRGTTANFTPGAAIGTFTGTTYVDSTAVAGTDYYYRAVATDSVADTVNAEPYGLTGASTGSPLAVCARLQSQRVGVVFIGDSITYGAEAGPGVGPTAACQAALAQQWGLRAVTVYDKGVSGYSTTEWQPGTSTYKGAASNVPSDNSAAYQYTQANPTGKLIFNIMLATNDSAQSGYAYGPKTPAAYQTDLGNIVSALLAAWPNCLVVLQRSPWYSPNAVTSYTYNETGLALLPQYFAAAQAIAALNPTQVFACDGGSYDLFAANYASELAPQSGSNGTYYIHPNAAGNISLGQIWATGVQSAISPPAKGSGGASTRISLG